MVDTNIFVSQLCQLRQLVDVHPGSPQESVVVYVPWAVLRELDALKRRNDGDDGGVEPGGGWGRSSGGGNLGRRARDAINFIHHLLVSKSERVSRDVSFVAALSR